MTTFSHSEVDTRNRCHRMWYYAYALGIEPNVKAVPLRRGILGHSGLEVFFKHLMEKPTEVNTAASKAFAEIQRLAIAMPEEYADVWSDVQRAYKVFFQGYPFKGWTVIAVEQVYMLDINADLAVPIVVDLVMKDLYGDLVVIDNKFLYNFPTGVENEILPQLPLYAGICRVNGLSIKKAAYSILRTRTLKAPTVETMYQLEYVDLTDNRIERNFVEHAIVAERCFNEKKLPIGEISWGAIRVKNPQICNSCDFSAICLAELNGHQPDLVLSTSYKERTRRTFV